MSYHKLEVKLSVKNLKSFDLGMKNLSLPTTISFSYADLVAICDLEDTNNAELHITARQQSLMDNALYEEKPIDVTFSSAQKRSMSKVAINQRAPCHVRSIASRFKPDAHQQVDVVEAPQPELALQPEINPPESLGAPSSAEPVKKRQYRKKTQL